MVRKLLVFMGVISLLGCKKSDTGTPSPITNPKPCQLVKYYEDGELTETMEYSTTGKLTKMSSYNSNGAVVYMAQLEYNAADLPVTLTKTGYERKIYFRYNADSTIYRRVEREETSTDSNYFDYSYNSAKQLIRSTEFVGGLKKTYDEFTYDTRGNVIIVNHYYMDHGTPVLIRKIYRGYDQNKNPFYGFGQALLNDLDDYGHVLSPNNWVYYKEEDVLTGDAQTMTNTYSYNVEGYPVSDKYDVELEYDCN